jgi:Mat/Ecp fimbriae major subunit
MKKLLISAGALAALALSNPALAATSNQAIGHATVNIVSPLVLTKVNDLDFGTIVGPFSGEVIEVTSAGARLPCPATVTCSGTTVGAATFTVTGTPSQNLQLTVDPSVTLTGPGTSMTVDLSGDLPAALATDASGNAAFGIGGKLTIPTGETDGVYGGDFNVQVDYQ